jgi:phosphoglycerate dehydrogenase-like enzyme
LERLKKIFHPAEFILVDRYDDQGVMKALERADVAVLTGDIDERFLKGKKLKWIHCDHAGLNKSARPEVFEKDLIITGSAGRSGPVLAEHAIYFMLAHVYHTEEFRAAQVLHQWGVRGQNDFYGLFGQTIGIFGMGHTGKELAIKAKAFGMNVLAYRRRALEKPEGVDKIYCSDNGDSIEEIVRQSDFIVMALNLSDQSYHLIGEHEFDIMKPNAFIVNMARGSVIDEKALIKAIKEGKIAGAGLDTFEVEPLPAESPLWNLPNVRITPHLTPRVPDRVGRSLDVIEENARRFRNGEALLNMLKPEDVYTK